MTTTMSHVEAPPSIWKSPVASYYLLAASTTLLVVIGLAVVLSSSAIGSIRNTGNPYGDFIRQLLGLGLGVVAMAIAMRLPPSTWRKLSLPILGGSMVLMALTAGTYGLSEGGNRAWLQIGPLRGQPSEIAKLGLALFLGLTLSNLRGRLTTIQRIMVPGGLAVIATLGFVLLGEDVGTATVIAIMAAAAFFAAGIPMRFFTMASVLAVAAMAVLISANPTRGRRLFIWLAEECDPQGACMQQLHAKYALASGGLWGLGPGLSREKWGSLPHADNDFIFAIVGEEFGLIGTLLVVAAFAMMVLAIHRIVQLHTDPFVQITAAGVGGWLLGQAMINIAVVTGLAPVTGVPLPLVSSGGSSLMMSLFAVGVLMSFARRVPGAQEAFTARPSVVRRSLSVVSRRR